MEVMLVQMAIMALLSGGGTEAFKWGWNKLFSLFPPKLTPLLSVVIGTALAGLDQTGFMASIHEATGTTQIDGAEIGAAGGALATFLHQLKTQPMVAPTKAKKALIILLLPFGLLLGGCGGGSGIENTLVKIQEHPAMKASCEAFPIIRSCGRAIQSDMTVTNPDLAKSLVQADFIIGLVQAAGCPPPTPEPAGTKTSLALTGETHP